ncbi:hypothetical protein KUCAC02_022774, partial [Chaenocephalus aceratus]
MWTPGSWSHNAKGKSHQLAAHILCEPCYISDVREVRGHIATLSRSCFSSSAATIQEKLGSLRAPSSGTSGFFSELPEMLCESEMEVEQHTCWSGQDVVE